MSKIVRELESQGENEVSSEAIGETVMEHLRELDDVAYVRFASVYRNFREAKDFEQRWRSCRTNAASRRANDFCHSGAPPSARLRASSTRYGGEPESELRSF